VIEEIASLNAVIKQLQQIPYLASKNLYRVVDYFLTQDTAKIELLCQVLLRMKLRVTYCPTCFFLIEKETACIFCSSLRRDASIICVTQTWQDVVSIEKTRGYTGVYHVLGGAICPLEGKGPEDLTIQPLVDRISSHVQEVIFATNQTPEGEATAAYLAECLKNKAVKISCLSRGLPVGASLEAMDRLTLYKALSERRIF
jgi:recombination protein RecR